MAQPRDHRIDLLRGLALAMIFVNHVPGTVWENFTSRNFGFSDAAEGFVLMSGIATGLAYGPLYAAGLSPGAVLRPWRRALTLWWVHVAVTLAILALFLLTRGDPAVFAMAIERNIGPALDDPLGFFLPLVTLGHQFAYADILPLYVLLMLCVPVLLPLALRWPAPVMAASLGLWLAAGLWAIRMPTWPLDNGWFFTPFSWQVLFVAGMLTGLALRDGRRWLPVRTWPLRAAWAYLVLAAVWVQVPAVADTGGHLLWLLGEHLGLPPLVVSFDKGFLFLPRLLHILALAYVLSSLPSLRRLAASPKVAPLVLMGRQSLPVFAIGTVLAYAGQVLKATQPPSALLDTVFIGAGLVLLYLVADIGAGLSARRRAKASRDRPGPLRDAGKVAPVGL